jgi:hypothetical protein
MNFRLSFYTLLVGVLLFGSCTQDPKEPALIIEEVLPGYWELISATRNGKSVPSLENTYFEFDSLGTVSTNFTGEQVVTEYNIVDSTIIYNQEGTSSKFDFNIIHQDTIVLNTVMRKIFKFELLVHRAVKK